MSPTFVCSNLPDEVRDIILAAHQQKYSGISLVFVEDERELEGYFLRKSPYVNRNHPAPHVVVIYIENAAALEQVKHYWKQIPGRKAPVLLMWRTLPEGLDLDAATLPVAGILDLGKQPDVEILLGELIDFWGTIVKLPMV